MGQARSIPVGVLAALAAVGAVRVSGIDSLAGWAEYTLPAARVCVTLGILATTYLLARLVHGRARRIVLLVGSLAAAAVFDVTLAALSVAWIASLHVVLFAGGGVRARTGMVYVIASLVVLGIACSRDLWPAFQARHPRVGAIGYLFAVAYPLRLAWMLHQVRLQRVRLPLVDMLLYLMLAPGFVIVPYMLAIPRLDVLRAGLDRPDPALERAGLRLLGWGLLLTLFAWALEHVYDARVAFYDALLRRDVLGVAVHSLPFYPMSAALHACATGALIVGMHRILGISLGPSFDRPLAASTITEFWRRWNIHFRELLVDLFYYPVLMRHRRHKVRAVVLGSFAVFVVGSTLLHLPKHYFRYGSVFPPNLHILVENLVMWGVVAFALVRELGSVRLARPPSTARTALHCLGTWCLVLIAVQYAGYGSQQAVFGYQAPIPFSARK